MGKGERGFRKILLPFGPVEPSGHFIGKAEPKTGFDIPLTSLRAGFSVFQCKPFRKRIVFGMLSIIFPENRGRLP